MPNFVVKWEIDIEADSPTEAAQEAQRIQRDPQSTATVFTVVEKFDKRGIVTKTYTVDLWEI